MPKKTSSLKKEASTSKPGISKSDFVRSQQPSMTAGEVIRRGKELGLIITESLVYNVRAADRKKNPKNTPQPVDQASETLGSPLVERQLRSCIIRVGLDRAEELFADFKRALSLDEPMIGAKRKPDAGANPLRPKPAGVTTTGANETKQPLATN
jgi:hypothetical protein